MGNFNFLAAEILSFWGARYDFKTGLPVATVSSDHPGTYTSMTHPCFGAKGVSYIEKKVAKYKLFLARRAYMYFHIGIGSYPVIKQVLYYSIQVGKSWVLLGVTPLRFLFFRFSRALWLLQMKVRYCECGDVIGAINVK